MFRMLASKQESRVAAHKPASRPASKPPQPISNIGIQRKAECACGGSCPRCTGLPVSQRGDALEREADQKADHVLRNVDPQSLSAKQTPQQITQLFGSYLNTDFSDVRLHTNDRAAASAKALGARAFTVGSEITFGRGQFAPHTAEGRKLLAHEFAHVVQQRDAPKQIQRQEDQAVVITRGVPGILDCTRDDLDKDPDASCCPSTTRDLIPGLYDTSREYIDRAIKRMESSKNMDGALQENFGAGALSQRSQILANLKTIQTELGRRSQHKIICRIARGWGRDLEEKLAGRASVDRSLLCDFGDLATGTLNGNVATLCIGADGQPAGGWDTLLHEMVHLCGVGNLPDRRVATPAQKSSGEFETYKGEKTYPNPNSFALQNADSYSSFVKTVGASSWTPESNPAALLPTLDAGGVMTLSSQPRFGVTAGMQWTPFGSNLQPIIGARALWLPHGDDEKAKQTDLRAYTGAELGLRWIGGEGNLRFILDVAGGGGPYVDVAGNVDPALATRLGAGLRVGGPTVGFGVSAEVMRLFHFDSSGLVGTTADDWLGGLVLSGHWGGTSSRPR